MLTSFFSSQDCYLFEIRKFHVKSLHIAAYRFLVKYGLGGLHIFDPEDHKKVDIRACEIEKKVCHNFLHLRAEDGLKPAKVVVNFLFSMRN